MEFTLPARIRKKGKWYISSCDVLDVHSQGLSREHAEKNLSDALASFLIGCFEMGTLDQVLREAGFVASLAPAEFGSRNGARGSFEIKVPVPFLLESRSKEVAAG